MSQCLNKLPPFFTDKLHSLVFFYLLLFLFSGAISAASNSDSSAGSAIDTADSIENIPNLSEIIPTSVNLLSNLAMQTGYFKNQYATKIKTEAVKTKYLQLMENVDATHAKFNTYKKTREESYLKYISLQQSLNEHLEILETLNKPIAKNIELLDGWEKQWQSENEQWKKWQVHFSEHPSKPLLQTFTTAITTIDNGSIQIIEHITPLLGLQAKGVAIQSKINILKSQIKSQIKALRLESLLDKSPPLYSALYYQQFETQVLRAPWNSDGLKSLTQLPFVDRHGLTYTLIILLFLGTALTIHRNKEKLYESNVWGFLPKRPIASTLFICSLVSAIQLEFWEVPKTFALLNSLVGSIACARLLDSILDARWKKQAVYTVMIAYVITVLLLGAGIPSPIFRLYILSMSILGFILCLRWNKINNDVVKKLLYTRILYFIASLYFFIIIAELFGQQGIASYIFKSLIVTLAIIVPVLLFFFLIRGAMTWLFTSSIVWQIKLMRNDAQEYARQTGLFFEVMITFFFVVPAILSSWQVFPSLPAAVSGIMGIGFMVGTMKISIGLIAISTMTLTATFFVSKVIPKIMLDESISGKYVERGARNSIARLIQYFIIVIGFLIAIAMIGIDLTKLTIILGALGVGIGFGLQGIVNNFVSGLILLFERPLREGDTITIDNGTSWAQIRKIGLRATIVQTFDNADVIIPNADLISNTVTNWTLQNRQMRVMLPIGVAYGSDVAKVHEILLDCAKAHELVLKSPAPTVFFLNLGDSSLDFQLRVWIQDTDDQLTVKSNLFSSIVDSFNKANIEIPFPQRDLHLRSTDTEIFKDYFESKVKREFLHSKEEGDAKVTDKCD